MWLKEVWVEVFVLPTSNDLDMHGQTTLQREGVKIGKIKVDKINMKRKNESKKHRKKQKMDSTQVLDFTPLPNRPKPIQLNQHYSKNCTMF